MNLTSLKSNKKKYQDLIFAICLAGAFTCFFLRAPYGFGFEDESWYLTFSHRFSMGDALIKDEWHLAQFLGFLLYLPTKLYISLTDSTDGIVLFFRYLFILFQSAVSAVIYWRLRKHGFFSIFAALIFFFHLPYFTFMSLNYYTMGLGFAILAGILTATATKQSKGLFFFVGLFTACAVLNNPPLAFVYFFYTICVIAAKTQKGKNNTLSGLSELQLSGQSWLWITIGISAMAAIVVAAVLSRSGINDILANLPMVFKDPEYQIIPSGSGGQNIFNIGQSLMLIIFMNPLVNIHPYLFAGFSLLFAALIFDKKRSAHRFFYLLAACLLYFVYAISIAIYTVFPFYTSFFLPFALLGLVAYILSSKKEEKTLLLGWMLGVLYSLCLDISTALGFYISSMGFLLSCVVSVIFIKELVCELLPEYSVPINSLKKVKKSDKNTRKSGIHFIYANKLIVFLLTAAIVFQVFQEAFGALNLNYSFEYLAYDKGASTIYNIPQKSGDKEKLNVALETGPLRGIKTTHSFARVYNGTLNDLSAIKQDSKDSVYITSLTPWFYLYLEMPYATGSTWCLSSSFIPGTNGFKTELQRLTEYYALHKDKVPKYIYVPKYSERLFSYAPEQAQETIALLDEKFDFYTVEKEYGFLLSITNYYQPVP